MRRWLAFLPLLLAASAFALAPMARALRASSPAYPDDFISPQQWNETDDRLTSSLHGYDGHGNVRFLLDKDGVTTDTYTYDAFGILIASTGTTPNPYRYCGERYDADLGMYYNRARYLNPAIGRLHTMDSFEGRNEDPLSLHKYLYAHADPINNLDPSGQFTVAGFSVSFSVSTYLASTAASYAFGKAVSAATLLAFKGSLDEFAWLEPWDALSLIPGAVIAGATAKIVRIPVELVTRTGAGKVVGKYFASGEVQNLVNGFRATVASTGGQLTLFSRNATRLVLKPEAFEHMVQRHMVRYWEGTTKKLTTFWPESMSASKLLDELRSVVSKMSPQKGWNEVTLSNGINARIYVDEAGLIKTFHPVSGPGVFTHEELFNALK